jgi:hypothetical protein
MRCPANPRVAVRRPGVQPWAGRVKKRRLRRKFGGFTVYNYCIVNKEAIPVTVAHRSQSRKQPECGAVAAIRAISHRYTGVGATFAYLLKRKKA